MKVNSLQFDSHNRGPTALEPNDAGPTSPAIAELKPPAREEATQLARVSAKLVVNGLGLGLRFRLDEATGRCIITVIDIESGEVVRQIPPEEAIEFLHQFGAQKGLFFSRHL
jgi:flagellar protein FlaG